MFGNEPPMFPMKKKKLNPEFGPIAMHARKIAIVKDQQQSSQQQQKMKGGESGVGSVVYKPVMYYRNMFTLYEGITLTEF